MPPALIWIFMLWHLSKPMLYSDVMMHAALAYASYLVFPLKHLL